MAKRTILKINFLEDYKLWKACAKKNDVRPVLEYVFFRNGYAYASDAHILVRVPLDLCTTFPDEQRELLDGYAIHGQMLKNVVKYEKVTVSHEVVVRDGVEKALAVLNMQEGENSVKVYLADNLTVTPPNIDRVMEMPKEMTSVSKIAMRAELLSTISDALGSKNLKTLFTNTKDRIFVLPISEENDSLGVMMPLMTLNE